MKDFGRRALFSFRAPVVSITPHKKDFCGGFEHLENLMECFSYDTSHDSDLIHTNPAVLPDNYLATTTTECAYMQIRDNEKLGIFPAQYRDTAVLLHSSFFKNKDIIEFVKRNVWATILIFGGSVPKEKFLCLAVDLNLMNLSTRNWDTEESEQLKNRVSNLISLFAIWLHGISCSADFNLSASRWKIWEIWQCASITLLYQPQMGNLSFLKSECLDKLREELGPEKRAKKSR